MEIISWVGISQALFAGILMANKKDRHLPDLILTIWLFFVAFDFLGQIATDANNLILQHTLFLIYNPLLYLYTLSLTKKNFVLTQNHFLHLLPFVIFLVSNLLFKPDFSLNHFWLHDRFFWYRVIYSITALFSFIIYTGLSIVLVHRHRKNLRNEFSSIEANRTLSWLLFVLIFYVLYNSLIIFNGLIKIFATIPAYPWYIARASLLILTYAFGFYGLKQRIIFKTDSSQIPNKKQTKYKNSRLSENDKIKIKNALIQYFKTEKPYINGDLTISAVAKHLNISRHILTEILNNEIGRNFYQFVNEYRINLAKEMLQNKKYDNYSIEAIGFECGFNSKSTFFTVFKTFTGLTPLQFKKSNFKH